MLILSRKSQESVVMGAADDLHELVRVTVVEVRGGSVKLGFKASGDVAIHREQVWERVRAEKRHTRTATAAISRVSVTSE